MQTYHFDHVFSFMMAFATSAMLVTLFASPNRKSLAKGKKKV
jgi:hypothetical protein